ncbi:DUF1569 domain-containing protein [Aquincola sp. S2]|uniref:DUF1569 domain-containing protein n=1 Tax=Pseudaquabacterium terrae TaxID=2732868 RepID=A0ABX2ES63_9BURK|nr:DUF1569 domain-containing protein [Aquabacterium terrae]NRF71580.1 DUF1569 domain-containing protein [Aquabacterium terrae]
MLRRRHLIVAGAAGAVLPLAGCGEATPQLFRSFAAARDAVAALAKRDGVRSSGAWPLSQVLQHAAQSIEYSIDGYPQPKSALFQGTVGAAAWALFNARGRMNHALDEPIPGAPALDAALPLDQAVARLLAAFERFERHAGALQPHFAYGALDKPAYARAHLMHLANHWSEVSAA